MSRPKTHIYGDSATLESLGRAHARLGTRSLVQLLQITEQTLYKWKRTERIPKYIGLACDWLNEHPEPQTLDSVPGEEFTKLRIKFGGWRGISVALGLSQGYLSQMTKKPIRGAHLYAIRQMAKTPYQGQRGECLEHAYMVERYGHEKTAKILGISEKTSRNWLDLRAPGWAQIGIKEAVARRATDHIGAMTEDEVAEAAGTENFPEKLAALLGVGESTVTIWVGQRKGGIRRAAVCGVLRMLRE